MADAPDSKSGPRKRVWVQLPPPALKDSNKTHGLSWLRAMAFCHAECGEYESLEFLNFARQRTGGFLSGNSSFLFANSIAS